MNSRQARPLLRFSIILFCALAAGLCLAHARSPISLAALQRAGYGEVPIKHPNPNLLEVAATVNGRSVTLIIDTGFGADGVCLNSEYSRSMGGFANAGGRRGQTVFGKEVLTRKGGSASVTMGNVRVDQVPLSFGNFREVTKRDILGSTGADGFVGSGFLKACSAVIDLQNLKLYLRGASRSRPIQMSAALRSVGLSEAPLMQLGDGEIMVDVVINGAAGKMIVDTGAFRSVVDMRLTSKLAPGAYHYGIEAMDAAGEKSEADYAWTKDFTVGGVPVLSSQVTLAKLGFFSRTGGRVIGLLGMDFLGQNWGIIDFGNRKLYFARAR